METAQTLINDALQELLVQGVEAPLEPSETQSAIRYLNRMMADFDAKGVSLGYTTVSNPSDPITVPDGAISAMVTNLAVRLAQQYGAPVSQTLLSVARSGFDAMLNLAVGSVPNSYGDTFPIGSGNERDATTYTHFYLADPELIGNETDQFIRTEENTEPNQ